jgi:hypothetical protein
MADCEPADFMQRLPREDRLRKIIDISRRVSEPNMLIKRELGRDEITEVLECSFTMANNPSFDKVWIMIDKISIVSAMQIYNKIARQLNEAKHYVVLGSGPTGSEYAGRYCVILGRGSRGGQNA